jgi:hypothetical protein
VIAQDFLRLRIETAPRRRIRRRRWARAEESAPANRRTAFAQSAAPAHQKDAPAERPGSSTSIARKQTDELALRPTLPRLLGRRSSQARATPSFSDQDRSAGISQRRPRPSDIPLWEAAHPSLTFTRHADLTPRRRHGGRNPYRHRLATLQVITLI